MLGAGLSRLDGFSPYVNLTVPRGGGGPAVYSTLQTGSGEIAHGQDGKDG